MNKYLLSYQGTFNVSKKYYTRRIVNETGEPLDDGSYIIYVNGAYKGDDEIGRLMHDFHSLKSEEMNYKELADGLHHFKETGKGRDTMCEAVVEFAKEYAEEYAKEYAEEYAREHVEEYAKEYAEEFANEHKILTVKNLMKNMNWT